MRFLFLALITLFFQLGCQQHHQEQPAGQSEGDDGLSKNGQKDVVTPKVSLISGPNPPVADKIPHELSSHGESRVDNFYWMRDDAREDPNVLSHLTEENTYANAVLADTELLQETLFNEITQRMKKDDATVPVRYKNHFYYKRFEGDAEYPIYARKAENLAAQEEILLDGNVMAQGLEYFAIGDYSVSTNEHVMAYSVDTQGRRIYTIAFKNLATGVLLEDQLIETTGQMVWANDNQTVFYVKKDPETLLGYQVFRHQLGTDQGDDELVYEEKDTSFYTWLAKSKDDSVISVVHGSTISLAASIINADRPKDPFRLLSPLEKDLEYRIAVHKDWYYILTNWKAKNYRIMRARKNKASNKKNWKEVVAHNDNVLLQDMDLFENHLVIKEKENGQSRIRVLNLVDKRSHVIGFDDAVYTASIDVNLTMNTSTVRIRYSSLTTPTSIYDYHMDKRSLTLRKQDEILGDFDPKQYTSERLFVPSRDGKKIPISLVYRTDMFKKEGDNPLYLYAYGSYGYSLEPNFSASRLSLLDRGFVFAVAHVRGSQTLGRAWYDDGKLFNKKNTFFDFIDATKYLVNKGYAHQDKVFAVGGSAGGLLVGAVINIAPELYRGVAAHVPFVDVVTTMSDPTIPLTTNEYDEWGNPADKAAYDYMMSYSPYDNVKAQDYPNILVTTGLHDSQVQYFEPAKWVAKLRENKTDDNFLLFKTNMDAGHGGASGRFRQNRERALEYAFFISLLNTENVPDL